MNSEYKQYSLENLENWLHDAISCSGATPKEIYDTIYNVIAENYEVYKKNADRCHELMSLMGNTPNNQQEDQKNFWTDFWEEHYYPEEHKKHSKYYYEYDRNDPSRENPFQKNEDKPKDKVKKWVLPVEETKIDKTDEIEYFVSFPDDLLEAANLKEGDQVEWVDMGDGSYMIKKVEPKQMTYYEAIAAGWTMTSDGFWIRE